MFRLAQWLCLLTALQWGVAFVPGADGPVTTQEALEGGSTVFYCDSSTPEPGDELMLLVWYRNNLPMYSYDARVQNEWCSPSFNSSGRVSVDLHAGPTAMTVQRLTEEDRALYHCRVDFAIAQTRNLGVNLTITVLPSQPFFLDEVGNKVEKKIGPYHDGDTLVLSCLVIGGSPLPRIRWYSGTTLVDDTDGPSDIPGVRENELYLPLNREHNASLSCSATNTKLAEPIVSTLDIELYLPASNVSITWLYGVEEGSLQAGRVAGVRCEARGAHPPPELTWWLDHTQLHQGNQSYAATSGVTSSVLVWTPRAADAGAALSCVATNVALAPAKASTTTTVTLNVTYSPIVEVQLVDSYRPDAVVELDPLRLQCRVSAAPAVHSISWYFNDTQILPGSDWGDNVSLATLVVLESRRALAGRYACAAANSVGETRSEPVDVAVHYRPECVPPSVSLRGTTLRCHTRATPPPDTFLWHVTSCGDIQKLTTGAPTLPLSQLAGPLESPLVVSCSASNGISSQQQWCAAPLSLQRLRPAAPAQCDLAFEEQQFYVRCIPVENATHYEVSLWRMSSSNASLVLERRLSVGLVAATSQALARGGEETEGGVRGSFLLRGAVGKLRAGDEAGAAACNRYGCSAPLLLRPTDSLLYAASPPWYNVFLDRDVGIAIGAVTLMAGFILSTILAIRLARRPRSKAPPVVQVLQLDDVAREYIDQALEHKLRASCSLRSCSSGYSGGSLESTAPPTVDRRRKPQYYWEHPQPPDVTLTLHRESAV